MIRFIRKLPMPQTITMQPRYGYLGELSYGVNPLMPMLMFVNSQFGLMGDMMAETPIISALTSCVLKVQDNKKLQHQRSYRLEAKKYLSGLEDFYDL